MFSILLYVFYILLEKFSSYFLVFFSFYLYLGQVWMYSGEDSAHQYSLSISSFEQVFHSCAQPDADIQPVFTCLK